MCTDGQELEHRRLIETEAGRLQNERCGNADEFGKRAIAMDAENLQVSTTVRFASSACDAGAAGEIRQHRDRVTGEQARICGSFDNFARELVADETRVGQIRLPAVKNMEVGPADADTSDADQYLTDSTDGRRTLLQFQPSRLYADNR